MKIHPHKRSAALRAGMLVASYIIALVPSRAGDFNADGIPPETPDATAAEMNTCLANGASLAVDWHIQDNSMKPR
jgi:hypothetical protein